MFEVLIKKIHSILIANTLISVAYTFEASEFSGDPAVVITPSSNESDYNTTQENMRIYAFVIRVFVRRTLSRKPEDADRIMREVVSSVLDDFDKDYTFSGLSVPTGYTFINTFATPSVWGYSGREDCYRVSEISIQCRVSVDLSSIS